MMLRLIATEESCNRYDWRGCRIASGTAVPVRACVKTSAFSRTVTGGGWY